MKCKICGHNKIVSKELKICVGCIRSRFEAVEEEILKVHANTRGVFGLPKKIPQEGDVKCNICVNECRIKEQEFGYCGTKFVENGKLSHLYGTPDKGVFDWYFDPLPTNCVAEWVCPGNDKYGYKNLAVFYRACSFNCLFCQNWHFKEKKSHASHSSNELLNVIDGKTFCICFFGGDPTPQILHAISVAEQAIKLGVRICWETNGSMNKDLADKMADLAYRSEGCVKFDIKFFNEKLNIALCGASNKNTLDNFKFLAEKYLHNKRKHPFLIASTLVIPGYIDAEEIDLITKFIAGLDPEIPYSLLVFYPNFYMYDLPIPSKKFVYELELIAKNNGLKNVNIGNKFLLIG